MVMGVGAFLPGLNGTVVIILGAFVYGFVDVVGDTASNTLPALVVDEEDYEAAYSSLQAVVLAANLVIGPGASGLLFGFAPWLPFASAAVCLSISYLLLHHFFSDPRAQATTNPDERSGWWTETLAGIRHVVATPAVRGVAITLIGIAASSEVITVLITPYVRDGHPNEPWPQTLGLVRASAGVISVLAALTVAGIVRKFGRERVMMTVALVGALSAAVLALAPAWGLVFLTLAASGAAEAMWVPLAQGTIIRNTPRDLLGRTRGAVMFITWGTLPLTSVLSGAVSHFTGINMLLVLGSALALVSCALGIPLFLNKRMEVAENSGGH
ncbi:hypothetical protein C6401_14070 [Arthrobacter woluwensis]|nr:hypothetical protein C6401_14070 [Arthrobacter woluwensis]